MTTHWIQMSAPAQIGYFSSALLIPASKWCLRVALLNCPEDLTVLHQHSRHHFPPEISAIIRPKESLSEFYHHIETVISSKTLWLLHLLVYRMPIIQYIYHHDQPFSFTSMEYTQKLIVIHLALTLNHEGRKDVPYQVPFYSTS